MEGVIVSELQSVSFIEMDFQLLFLLISKHYFLNARQTFASDRGRGYNVCMYGFASHHAFMSAKVSNIFNSSIPNAKLNIRKCEKLLQKFSTK